jgi:hypothetical protein
MRGLAARRHHAVVAARVWGDVAFRAPAFGAMGRLTRFRVGICAAASILVRFTLADLVRGALGTSVAASLENRISALLRARDGR